MARGSGWAKGAKILGAPKGKLLRVGYLQYDYDGDKRFDSLLTWKSPRSVASSWNIPEFNGRSEVEPPLYLQDGGVHGDGCLDHLWLQRSLGMVPNQGTANLCCVRAPPAIGMICGFIMEEVYQDLAQRLLELGHKRISKIIRKERKKPVGHLGTAVLRTPVLAGIRTDSISLPDWRKP